MSDHLDATQLARLRTMLDEERDRLRKRVGVWHDEAPEEGGDSQDLAAREAGARDEQTAKSHDLRRMAEVDAALARMDAGTYGICESSDEPIPFARLLLEPTARYTVEAQEELEAERDREDREGGQPY